MIAGLILGIVLLVLLAVAAFVLLFIFWIFMLIDCLRRDFRKENEKIVWVLVIVLLGFIGASVYYFVVKAEDKKSKHKTDYK